MQPRVKLSCLYVCLLSAFGLSGALFSGCGGSSGSNGLGGAGGSTGGGGGGTPGGQACGATNTDDMNDSRDTATPYTLGTTVAGCVGTRSDLDFYELTVPNDPAGGYLQVSVSDVGPGSIAMKVYSAADNGELSYKYSINAGQSVNVFFAVAPMQKYRLDVHDFSAWDAPYGYKLTATYTKIDDAFEPNDTRATAKPLTLNTESSGFFFAGYTSGKWPENEAYEDWYSIALGAGSATVELADVATDVAPDLLLYGPDGAEIAREYSITQGASVTLKAADLKAGTHYIKVGIFAPTPEATDEGTKIFDHFTRPYKLTAKQP